MNINFLYLNEFAGGYEYYEHYRTYEDLKWFLRDNLRWGYTEAYFRAKDESWDSSFLKQIKLYDYVVCITAEKQTSLMEKKVAKLNLQDHVYYRQQEPSFNVNYPGEGRRLTTWIFSKKPKAKD